MAKPLINTKAIKNIKHNILGREFKVRGAFYDKTVGVIGERQFGISENNFSEPDLSDGKNPGVELKFFASKHTLQTLLCSTPKDPNAPTRSVLRPLIEQMGYDDEDRSRRAFYHTFQNGSDKLFRIKNIDRNHFELVRKDGRALKREDGTSFRLVWDKRRVRSALQRKFSRLFLIPAKAQTKGRSTSIKYKDYGIYYEHLRTANFWSLLKSGVLVIDFRCHIDENGKVRDHGVAFRMEKTALFRLFEFNEVLRKA